MINAVIVDDEPYSCESLATLLEQYCPAVKTVAICHSGEEGLEAIGKHRPQILFLDIEMPKMNGFELLEKIPELDFYIIFTTSYDHYAIRAIRFSALDYLLKPIDREDLQKAVQKVVQKLHSPSSQQLEILLHKLQHPPSLMQKIALPTMEGINMVAVNSIISCAADSNYTVLFLKDRQKIVVSRTLKEIEDMLGEYSFLRVHHSFVVNLNEVTKYIKGEGGYLIMSDESTIDVSRSKKEMLIRKLHKEDQ